MTTDLLYPDDIDSRLNWPPGRTSRLAKAGKIPHYVLPDGAIRLRWEEVEPLVRRVQASHQPHSESLCVLLESAERLRLPLILASELPAPSKTKGGGSRE